MQPYLIFEQATGNPAWDQIWDKHAITKFLASADLWLLYTEYLDRTLRFFSFRLSFLIFLLAVYRWIVYVLLHAARLWKYIYHRATWNSSCVGESWVRYLHILECLEEDLSACFRRRYVCGKFWLFPLFKFYK